MKHFTIISLFASLSLTIAAQENISSLKYNFQQIQQQTQSPVYHIRRSSTLSLPFIDDFSYQSIFPDPARWTSNHVFINSTLPINPPSVGVATFDGLRSNGEPYSYSNNNHGPADSLTSQEIDLAGKSAGDSIYLSFWYQYQGNGNAPEDDDSLILQFKVNDSTWNRVWKMDITAADNDTFNEAMIHIAKAIYLHGNFQFRFVNYATRTGNHDHWHVDYVILDEGRTVNNRYLNDVAFTQPAKPLLKNYFAMPLSQLKGFELTELADSLFTFSANHFNVIKNTTYRYEATEDCNNTTIKADFIETINFPSLSDTVLREPNFKSDITSLINSITCDSLIISTKYFLNNSPPDLSTNFNDTIYHQQKFFNYLAYDDGSAELGYGLEGIGAELAYQFHVNQPDTLRAIRIHFAHLNRDVSNLLFSIRIWSDIDTVNGTADQILYQQHFETPNYVDSMNGYFTYRLDTAKLVSGTFYIGWLQSQSDNLRVGFDINQDASAHTFFKVGSNWKKTVFNGAIMMQPVLGKKLPGFGVGVSPETNLSASLNVVPNPSTNTIKIVGIPSDINPSFKVLNLNGQVVLDGNYSSAGLDISVLPQGFYVVALNESRSGYIAATRFLKY